MQWLACRCGFAKQFVQALGPYLLVEILLPGGSLIALALFLYRQRRLPFALDRLVPARTWMRRLG